MAEIFKFPDEVTAQWRVMEKALRSGVEVHVQDPDAVNHIIAGTRAAFFACSQDFTIDFEIKDAESAMRNLDAWVKKLFTGLLFQIVLREAELYRLRGSTAGAG